MTRGRRHCEERDNAETPRKQSRADKDGERKIATTADAENTETRAGLPRRGRDGE